MREGRRELGRLKSAHNTVLDTRREFLAQRQRIEQQLRSAEISPQEERQQLASLVDKLSTRLKHLVPVVQDGRQRIAELRGRESVEASEELSELAGKKMWTGQRDKLTSAVEATDSAIGLTEEWLRRESKVPS